MERSPFQKTSPSWSLSLRSPGARCPTSRGFVLLGWVFLLLVVLAAHLPAEDTANCVPEGDFGPGALARTTACGATGVKHRPSSLSRDPVLHSWSWMGNRCSSKWQKRCYPIALRRWEIGHIAFEQFPSFPRIKISVPWVSDLLRAAHLGHFTNLSGGDLLDTSGLLLFLKLSKGLLYLWLFPPFAWHGVGYPRRDACRALKWGRLSVGSLKTKLCRSTCSIPLQRKSGWQEQRQSRVRKMQFYSKWNLKPTTRNKRFLRNAVVRKGEHIFQANCKSSGNSWLTIYSKWYKGEGRDSIQHKSYL